MDGLHFAEDLLSHQLLVGRDGQFGLLIRGGRQVSSHFKTTATHQRCGRGGCGGGWLGGEAGVEGGCIHRHEGLATLEGAHLHPSALLLT